MPTIPLTDAQLVEALDLVEEHGSPFMAVKLGAKLTEGALRHRHAQALVKGLKPTARKDAPRVYQKNRLGRMHIVIPDVQAKADVPLEHLGWIGNFIVEKKPDCVVQIGDFADMPSLSVYDKGKLSGEGRRYSRDIHAVHKGMDTLMRPLQDYNRTAVEKYKPEMELTLGNHEHRIIREVENNPQYEGHFSYDDLKYEDYGWRVHDFLKVIKVDGVEYSHFFTSGAMGRPVSSAAAMLRERQNSCTMGHVQHTDVAIHKKTQNIALFCGICYLHDEPYLGAQGNATRRQIVVKHEVADGKYDLMFVSLEFLKKNYS